VMTREEVFDPNHVSVKPQAKQSARQSVAASPSGAAAYAA